MNYWIIPCIKSQIPEPNLDAIDFPIVVNTKSNPGRIPGVSDDVINRRHAVCHILQSNGWSYKKMADKFGLKGHSTVLKNVKKFRELLSVNDELALNLEAEYKQKLFTYDT